MGTEALSADFLPASGTGVWGFSCSRGLQDQGSCSVSKDTTSCPNVLASCFLPALFLSTRPQCTCQQGSPPHVKTLSYDVWKDRGQCLVAGTKGGCVLNQEGEERSPRLTGELGEGNPIPEFCCSAQTPALGFVRRVKT